MDYQLIEFSNFMQALSCICHILAMCDGSFRELAVLVDLIADLVTFSVAGCMTAQVRGTVSLAQAVYTQRCQRPPQVNLEIKDAQKRSGPAVAVPMGAPATTINDEKVEANEIARE